MTEYFAVLMNERGGAWELREFNLRAPSIKDAGRQVMAEAVTMQELASDKTAGFTNYEGDWTCVVQEITHFKAAGGEGPLYRTALLYHALGGNTEMMAQCGWDAPIVDL